MDKKELLQQLVHMKKEYARKCKRLQLAIRAKNSREHVRRKIQEQNESIQNESCDGTVSSPIVLSSQEKTLDLNLSDLSLENDDTPAKEKLQSKNIQSVTSRKQKPALIQNSNENVSRCSQMKETTVSTDFGDSNKNIENHESTSTENQSLKIISPRKLVEALVVPDDDFTKSESSEASYHSSEDPPKKNIDNVNSCQLTESLKSSTLSSKPKTADSVNDYDFSLSPPTIRRKRKHSASFREILPRTTKSGVEFRCDINQSSVDEKPKQKRRSYKKEEQNVILLSVLDYIIEEGKHNTSFKEFQLPDFEYAQIKERSLNKKNLSRKSYDKENLDSKSDSSLKKSSDILNSANLEESGDFQKNLAGNLQNTVPEHPVNDNSCKLVSRNVLDCTDLGSKNSQKCLFETESTDTPVRIPKHNVDPKTERCHLDNSKCLQKCLPFTKRNSVDHLQNVTINHQPNRKCIRGLEESQDLLDCSKENPSKTVDLPKRLINDQSTNQKSKTFSVDLQVLDSVGFDESFDDKVPLFPQCSDGLSQFSAANDSVVPSVSNRAKRWHNTGSPTASSKNNPHLHGKEHSPQRENELHCSDCKTDISTNNNKKDIYTIDVEKTVTGNKTIPSENISPVQSELTEVTCKENKHPKSTTGKTLCDKSINKNMSVESEKKDLESSGPYSTSRPNISPAFQHNFDHSLCSSENISKHADSQPQKMTPSLIVNTCVHNFSSSLCDSDKFNNKTFPGFNKAESFKLPDSNEEVVSLLNSRSSPFGNNDCSPIMRDLLVCVTQYSIYFWTLTKLGQWKIVHQQQITELEQCCHASLHPYQNGVGVATVLINTEGESQLVLHTFQMQENIKKNHLPVTLQEIHKLLYTSLDFSSMAVARTSSDKTIEVCKYIFSENLSNVQNILTLDSLSEKLLSLSAVQGLPAALLGFTVNHVLLIWNHVANVLLTRITLSDILVKSCTLPSAFTEQGHIVFPLIFDDGPEQGCLLAVNPNTDVVVKLLSYQRHLFPETKSDSKLGMVLHGNLLSVQDNVLGIWDLYSGCLLACVNSLGMTCMTLLYCNKETLLITGHKQSCLHIYRSQPL